MDISALTPAERLQLLEELWESLSSNPDEIPLTKAQRAELDRRLDDLDREGPNGAASEDVLHRIRNRSL